MVVHTTMVAIIIMAVPIETPTTEIITVDSETKVMVTKTAKETKAVADSEIRAVAVLRELNTTKAVADSEAKTMDLETLKALAIAPADQNLQIAVDLETAQAPKVAVLALQPDRTAVAEALDKTIINKETNS